MADRFEIKVENADELYKKATEVSYIDVLKLGEILLNQPLERISLAMTTDGTHYCAEAEIIFQDEKQPNPSDKLSARFDIMIEEMTNRYSSLYPDLNISCSAADKKKNIGSLPLEELAKKYDVKHVTSAVYVTDKDGKPEFEVTYSRHGIKVCFGIISRQSQNQATQPRKIGSQEEFASDFGKYLSLVQCVVNALYAKQKEQCPDITLYARPFVPLGAVRPCRHSTTKLVEEDREAQQKPDTTFADIGGQEEAKNEMSGLCFAITNPEEYEKWGTKPPKGVLLYGPPGTGKTMMAKALAGEAGAKFYHVKISDLVSKWYGEAEQRVQQVFDIAKKDEKAILFFDELDALAPSRDGAHEATRRMVSTLLENMDGMDSQDHVMVIGATNRLDSIDEAIVRPGRMDRKIEVGLPDEEARKQILNIHMNRAEKIAKRHLFKTLGYDKLLEATEGFSGADISEIIRRTLEKKVRESMSARRKPKLVSTEDLLNEISGYESRKKEAERLGFHSRSKAS